VIDERPAGVELVAAEQRCGARIIQAPLVQRTRSPTAGVVRGSAELIRVATAAVAISPARHPLG
jgi:hypothetical protein